MGEKLLGKRVLIVEDEALLALELELAFSDNGAEIVGPALSLSHGVMLVEAHFPALAVLRHLGSVGVDLFFVLSGFLIGGILWRTGAQLRSGRVLMGFWLRRWLRTLPNYYFFLVVAVLVLLATRPQSIDWLHRVLPTALFVQNFAQRVTPFFPESWTLAVEEWFYLLFPAALWLGHEPNRQAVIGQLTHLREEFEARPEFRVSLARVEGASDDLAVRVEEVLEGVHRGRARPAEALEHERRRPGVPGRRREREP